MSRISQTSRTPQTDADGPIHRIFHAPQSDLIRLGQPVGRGAEGEVYEVQDRSDLVAKIYHEPPPPEKAEKLIALSRLGSDRLFNLSAWPVDALRNGPDGPVAGFLMKKISQAEEVHALHSPKSRLQKFPEASWEFLIYVAANIARAVAAIHEHGFVIGDVNPKNILVTRKATVYLLDVDSFQVTADDKTYRCEGGFPEYTPPELQGIAFRDLDRRQEHDYFGLAVVIFQLLFLGRHPFSGRFLGVGEMPLEQAIREYRFAYGEDAETRQMRQPPGSLSLDAVSKTLTGLFHRAFLSTDRPHPREWITSLEALTKSLKKCPLHSGHSYFQELAECPWCEIEMRARVRLFNFLLPGADSQRGHFRLDDIWKEIERIETPVVSLTRQRKSLAEPAPSPEIEGYAKGRSKRFFIALFVSVIAGLFIPLLAGFPLAFPLLIAAGWVVIIIAKVNRSLSGQMQALIQWKWGTSGDSIVEKISVLRRDADYKVNLIEERWGKEASGQRFLTRLDELRNQKETYENLAQIRQFKLQQLEAEARKHQLNEFLDLFEIRDAEINGIGSALKSSLLSYGIETAADVNPDVTRIPTIGPFRAEKLLEWRGGLERNFIFDPIMGVSPIARVQIEKEVDMLRLRLEHELSGGVYYLNRVKKEIEESRRELQPVLDTARQTLAQAEKDWAVVSKPNSLVLILVTLMIAFFIGCAIDSRLGAVDHDYSTIAAPPSMPELDRIALAEERQKQEALNLYRMGMRHSQEGEFAEAAVDLQQSVEKNPNLNIAFEELGYVLYRLKRYEESADASKAAIRIHADFRPFYNLGLVHDATGNWHDAMLAFQRAIQLRDESSWKDEYTNAYYLYGRSLLKVGEIQKVILALEKEVDFNSGANTYRFELATLYLWAGRRKAAMEQYKILKGTHLAEELLKLMKKHRIRINRPDRGKSVVASVDRD